MTPPRVGTRRDLSAVLVVLVASLLLGGATSWAQGFLPEPLTPFANSASGWTLLTALLVWSQRRGTATSAVLGLVCFVCLVLGYSAASALRGLFYSPVRFGVIAVLAGPLVGVAAAWLRRREWHAAFGTGVLAGIAAGESIYGLTVVSATTGTLYWTLVGLLGVALLTWTLTTRTHALRVRLGCLGLTAATAAGFNVAYRIIGS
jgi:hypothetical protein